MMATTPMQHERVHRRLQIVRSLAIADALLVILLIAAAVTGKRAVVHVLGPIHGINYLVLLVTATTATLDGLWSWWFPALIFVTGGPVGAFIGERAIARRLATPTIAEGEGRT